MNELKAKLEALEVERFYLSMKDRWTQDDFNRDHRLFSEIQAIKKQMKGA